MRDALAISGPFGATLRFRTTLIYRYGDRQVEDL